MTVFLMFNGAVSQDFWYKVGNIGASAVQFTYQTSAQVHGRDANQPIDQAHSTCCEYTSLSGVSEDVGQPK